MDRRAHRGPDRRCGRLAPGTQVTDRDHVLGAGVLQEIEQLEPEDRRPFGEIPVRAVVWRSPDGRRSPAERPTSRAGPRRRARCSRPHAKSPLRSSEPGKTVRCCSGGISTNWGRLPPVRLIANLDRGRRRRTRVARCSSVSKNPLTMPSAKNRALVPVGCVRTLKASTRLILAVAVRITLRTVHAGCVVRAEAGQALPAIVEQVAVGVEEPAEVDRDHVAHAVGVAGDQRRVDRVDHQEMPRERGVANLRDRERRLLARAEVVDVRRHAVDQPVAPVIRSRWRVVEIEGRLCVTAARAPRTYRRRERLEHDGVTQRQGVDPDAGPHVLERQAVERPAVDATGSRRAWPHHGEQHCR